MMNKLITAFPQNLLDALDIAAQVNFQKPKNPIHNILICGMGGSGIGGKIVAQWVEKHVDYPVNILNDYDLPAFVNESTLVIGSSYSGNTEETLSAIYDAHKKGAHIIGICSGGDLQSFCQANNLDCIVVPGGNPPRTAIAFSIVQLTNIFVQLGLVDFSFIQEIRKSFDLLLDQSNDIHLKAKEIASFMFGKVGVIYSGPAYEAVAVRARQQFNENSKYLCWHHVIPEMNHNELVGWGGGDSRFVALFLNTGDLNPRNQKRYDISKDVIAKKSAGVMELTALGASQIQKSMYLIHLVDWASYYLSEMNKADIMDIKIIDYLKGELANF